MEVSNLNRMSHKKNREAVEIKNLAKESRNSNKLLPCSKYPIKLFIPICKIGRDKKRHYNTTFSSTSYSWGLYGEYEGSNPAMLHMDSLLAEVAVVVCDLC